MIVPNNKTNPDVLLAMEKLDRDRLESWEGCVLVAVFCFPGWIDEHREQLQRELFHTAPHRAKLLDEILRQHRQGIVPTFTTIADTFRGTDDELNVAHELNMIDIDRVLVTPDMAERCIDYLWRPLKQSDLHDAIAEALQGDIPNVAAARTALDEFDQHKNGGRSAYVTLADVDDSEHEIERLPTGLKFLDEAQPLGSIVPGDKLVVASAPGVGKSALGVQVTLGTLVTNPDAAVVWGMGEMTLGHLKNRARLCFAADWPDHDFDETTRRLHVVSSPLTPARLEAAIKATSASLCVVDYLQLARADIAQPNRRDNVDAVIFALTEIAQRERVAMIWLSNLAKADSERRDAYSFKESSEIGHACDLAYVAEVTSTGDYARDQRYVDIRWHCVKARHGQPLDIETTLDRDRQAFRPNTGIPT